MGTRGIIRESGNVPPMSRVQEAVVALSQIELFQGLAPSHLAKIATMSQWHEFADGDTVVKEGDTDGQIYVLLSGTARMWVGGRPFGAFGAGDYFGEMSLLDGQPRSATVVATAPVHAVSIARFNFLPLLTEHPEIAEELLIEMCRRLRLVQSERVD
jgi:CRP/FNR family cyclic AMP-dependent transcriptional regulator